MMVRGMLLWVWLWVAPALAQDMVFGLEETGPPPGPGGTPAVDAPPSALLASGLRAYASGAYPQAAVQLQRVVQGDSTDGEAGVQRAQFHLAKALMHLGFDQSALVLFDEITRAGPHHRHFDSALSWLAQLSLRFPDPSAVAPLVGRYQPADLTALSGPTRDRLRYLMGRAAYDERELEQAIALWSRLPSDSPLYPRARLLLGIAHVRAHRARPAIAAFRETLRALEAGDAPGVEDADGLAALAWLSLGRIYYTAALGGREQLRGQLLGNAVAAWSNVDDGSDYWLDALFESSWALFVADQHARALGNLHALLSPFFVGAFYPEAHVIKAVAFYHSCQMDNASAVVHQYHERYGPLRDELAELLSRRKDGFALFTDVRARRLHASPRLVGLLSHMLRARDLQRVAAQLAALGEQEKRLEAADPGLRDAALGQRIAKDLQVAEALSRIQLGELLVARAQRRLEELREIANQMDAVEIEVLNFRRQRLQHPPQAPRGGGGEVHVDSEHVLWPFNGEYWRDELGYYRQQVTDRCPAR